MNALRAWLARPLGWFTFVLAEYVVTITVLRLLMPADTPLAIGSLVLIGLVVGIFALNLWLRRRLPPSEPRR